MKHLIAVTAVAVTLAQPAAAITFPSLTTIYVGTGVVNFDAAPMETVFNCSNVSGVTASVRFLVLDKNAVVVGNATLTPGHGGTVAVGTSTLLNSTFGTDQTLVTGTVNQGVINIESTQSGVFCNAIIVTPDAGEGITLPLVRVNPHPGTVE